MAGSWVLVAFGYVASRQGDIQPFYDRASLAFWRECGFERRPSYSTTHARLTELEQLAPAVEEAMGRMVRRYIELEPRIGRHLYVDGTEAETHSRFFHDCRDDEYCASRREGETAADVNRRRFGRASTEAAQRRRQEEDAGEVEGEAEETVLSSEPAARKSGAPSPAEGHGAAPPPESSGHLRPLYRQRTSNHSYLTHDPDAGFRSYLRANGTIEGWHGYYHFAAIDVFTGLPLSTLVTSSSRTEQSQYEQILQGVIRTMNGPENGAWLDDEERALSELVSNSQVRLPQAVIGDRGFAYPSIYEMNTRLGIQTVTPWRNFGDGRKEPTEILVGGRDGHPCVVDRHRVIHCRHCGGPTKRM
jgi:hypothetical protein